MAADTPPARQPWWRDLRWITAVVVVTAIASIAWGLFGPEPRVVVSRETTFITEPLRPDGLPDYAAYVLDLMGRGTPPEENAAVAVLEATWPMDLDPDQLQAVCKALGIPDARTDIAPLVWADADEGLRRGLAELLAIDADDPVAAGGDPAIARDAAVDTVIDRSRTEPWRAADCAPLAAWVAGNAATLDHVVAAAARPRYQMSPPELLAVGSAGQLVGASLHDIQATRNIARALATRAMLHAGEGRHGDAWRDIHAIHRLSRLLAPAGRGGFMVTHLVSIAIGSTANGLTLELLQSPDLPAGEVAAIRRDLEALPPRAEAAATLELERVGGLDVALLLPRARRGEWAAMVDLPVAQLRTSLDVNVVLRQFNAFYDRIDAAARLPDRAARTRAVADIDAGLSAPPRVTGPLHKVGWWLRMAASRSARSDDVAARLLSMLGPSIRPCLDAIDRAHVEFDLLRVAAALAEHCARGLPERSYPDALDALVPDLLAALPSDPFANRPLVYERRGDGYLLYAVGTNGVDEGGTSGDVVKGEWQPPDPTGAGPEYGRDNVIRVPTPRRGLLPAP